MNVYVLAAWTAVGAATVVAAVPAGRLLRMPRAVLAAFVVLCVAAAGACILLARALVPPGDVQVAITAPANRAIVAGNSVRVSGTVRPAAARVTLVIRAERDVRWWVQPVVASEPGADGAGRWAVDGVLGTKSEGIGQTFEIVALASSDSLPFNVITGRHLSPGDSSSAVPLWSQSPPILVWRQQ